MARHYGKGKGLGSTMERGGYLKEAAHGFASSQEHDPRSGKNVEMPNNPRGSMIEEDWSQPALLKRGVHEFDVTYHANKHKSGRLGDLYEQVDKTTREDQAAFDSLTDPHNW